MADVKYGEYPFVETISSLPLDIRPALSQAFCQSNHYSSQW